MKYRFVKRRKEISADQISSMKDFGTVLKGSTRLLDIAYKSKLLWTLTVPVAVVVYTLAVNPPATPEEIPEEIKLEQEAPILKEGESATPLKEGLEEHQNNVDDPHTKLALPSSQEKPASSVKDKTVKENLSDSKSETSSGKESSKELVTEDVYENAEPKTGFADFYKFMDTELTYPELARKDSIEGQVKVLFTIDRSGDVDNVKILESLGPLFDNEAIRVIKRLPAWNPATFNGQPVSSRRSIILTFKMKKTP